MKILITGACGHIGSYLSENIYKIKKVSKAILIDNLKSNRFNSLFHSQKKNNLNFFVRDLNNINCLDDINNIDTIIHCASMTNAEKSFFYTFIFNIYFDFTKNWIKKLRTFFMCMITSFIIFFSIYKKNSIKTI